MRSARWTRVLAIKELSERYATVFKGVLQVTVSLLALAVVGCGTRKPNEAPPADSVPSRVDRISVLTYNVLAGSDHLERRLPALLQVLKSSNADIIALQEANEWLLSRLEDEPWYRERYYGTLTNGYLDAPGGQCILSRFPIDEWSWLNLPGMQGRAAVIVRTQINGQPMIVATAHLESRPDDGAMRARQLDRIFEAIGNEHDAIMLGDLNFSDGWRPETDHLDELYNDVWKAIYPDKPGFTWDIERNKLARKGSFPNEKSGRVDRILVKSSHWRAASARLFADEPLAADQKDLFPSDHFGVIVEFVCGAKRALVE